MSTHADRCPHCWAKAGIDGSPTVEVEPIAVPELPALPRLFRIHYPEGRACDYTLHPDGRLTMRIGSEVLSTSLDFAFMADTSWADAHIEWDPDPLPEPERIEARPDLVQDAIPLGTP